MKGEKGLEAILSKYKAKPGNLIKALQEIQRTQGYISKETMKHIATALGIKPSEVYGVATFYAQFRFTPVGKNIIKACDGTACHVGGAERIREAICEKLEINPGETTPDMKFTLEKVACLGCCSLAPVVMIRNQAHGRLTERKVKKILDSY